MVTLAIRPQEFSESIRGRTAKINFCVKAAFDLGSIETRDVETALEDYEALAHAICPKDLDSRNILKEQFAEVLKILQKSGISYDISKYLIVDVWTKQLNRHTAILEVEEDTRLVANF